MKPELLPRKVALDIIGEIVAGNANTSVLFDQLMRQNLSDLDKSFIRALVLSTTRHLGQIDFIISQLMTKPLAEKLSVIQNILRMGVAQIIYLKMPAHACVDTSVELVKIIKKSSFTNVVNGVLRNVVRREDEFLDVPAIYNMPSWLKGELRSVYGKEKTDAFADAFLIQPPTDITVKKDAEFWREELGGVLLSTGSIRLSENVHVPELKGFAEGAWWVQNAAASIPAQLFSDINGKTVADLCAAPGGKTAQLANNDAIVTAYDVSTFRLNRLKENMNRLGFDRVQLKEMDIENLSNETMYDAVLLDAPCSATGTIARHPEILVQLTEDQVRRIVDLQKKLLETAVSITNSGGQIVYATCSILPREGEEIIAWALQKFPNLKRGQIPVHLKEFVNVDGDIRTVPDQNMDGFFASILIKEA